MTYLLGFLIGGIVLLGLICAVVAVLLVRAGVDEPDEVHGDVPRVPGRWS